MRFRLRALLIVLALGPPVLAGAWAISSMILKPHVVWEDFGGPGSIGPSTFEISCDFGGEASKVDASQP